MADDKFIESVRHEEDIDFINAISIFVEESEFLISSVLGTLTLYTENDWEYVTAVTNTENKSIDFVFMYEDEEEIISVKVNQFKNSEEIEQIVDDFICKFSKGQCASLMFN